jgi:hypothetical protein
LSYDYNTKRGVFEASQDEIIVPQANYGSAYNNPSFPLDPYVRIDETSKTFETISSGPVTIPFESKAIHDEMGAAFETDYGRMSGFLGLEVPFTGALNQNFLLYPFAPHQSRLSRALFMGRRLDQQVMEHRFGRSRTTALTLIPYIHTSSMPS